MADFVIVQHGEKEPVAGDPPLNPRGRAQAAATADYLSRSSFDRIVSSPMRRARETAQPIATALRLELELDDRLGERMNWDGRGTAETFLAEWVRATQERDYVPPTGVSSLEAGERFVSLLDCLSQRGGRYVLVSHGGTTLDGLRTLFGDEEVRRIDGRVFDQGVPCCALTFIAKSAAGYRLHALGDTAHLPAD